MSCILVSGTGASAIKLLLDYESHFPSEGGRSGRLARCGCVTFFQRVTLQAEYAIIDPP